MEPILRAEHLTKTFRRKGQEDITAVNDVSFELMPGECLGIIGESGSGKSTVAHLLTRLTEVTEGSICLHDKDITRQKGAALRETYRKIQMVFQTPAESFDPRRTLGDGIAESMVNVGTIPAEVKKRTRELLVRCGLSEDFAKRYPHQVSGGQCQRAAIARAIAVNPEILICDEATSALDVTIQKEILELLNELKEEHKMAYIFICHDIALVQQFCDRVLVMYHGKIVEQGIPDVVIRNPQNDYTKRLIASIL